MRSYIFIIIYTSIEKYAFIVYQGDDFEEIMTYFISIGSRVRVAVVENNIYHISYIPIVFSGNRVVINKNKKTIYGPEQFLESFKKKLDGNKSLVKYSKGFYFTYNKKCRDIFAVSTELNKGNK